VFSAKLLLEKSKLREKIRKWIILFFWEKNDICNTRGCEKKIVGCIIDEECNFYTLTPTPPPKKGKRDCKK